MGHDSNQGLGVDGRSDELNIPPDRFDFIEDKSHASYDPRVHMPLDLDMLENIREAEKLYGPRGAIRERVTVRRNGERLLLVKGRMRVRCALKLAEEGIKILVPTKIVRYSDDASAYEDTIRENEQRGDTPPSMRAQQAQKMLDFGRTKEQVATMFRFRSVQGLELMLLLLDLDPKVQKRVDKGEFPATLASTELSKFSREEQVSEMEKLLVSGAKGEIAKETLRQRRRPQNGHAKDAEPIAKMRTRIAITKALEGLKGAPSTKTNVAVRAFARWVMGQDRAFNQCPDLGKIVRGDE